MQKLTIITINFNNKEGLKRTIDSIVNQTFTDYEWIVVDGGSTDGSKDLLEQYKDRFAWWCSEPDKGVYNAMNKGITHATGEYINFMNSGDSFASSTILTEIFLNTHTAEILYGKMARESVDGKINNLAMMKPNIHWWDFYDCTFNHQATFIRTDIFAKYGVYDETYRILADWRHFAELVCIKKVTCEYIPQIVAVYEGGGLSDVKNSLPEILRIREELYPMVSQEDITEMKYYEKCNRYWLSRQLYFLLTRGTNRLIRLSNKYTEK